MQPPEEALDALLRDYFKSQMPSSWPAWRPPAVPARLRFVPPPTRKQTPRRPLLAWSRVALAAGIALLFLAAWLLPGRMSPSGDGLPKVGPGTAENVISPTKGPPPSEDGLPEVEEPGLDKN